MVILLVPSGITFISVLMTIRNTLDCCGIRSRTGPGMDGIQGNWLFCAFLNKKVRDFVFTLII